MPSLSFDDSDTVFLTRYNVDEAVLALSVLPQRHPLRTLVDQLQNRIHRLTIAGARIYVSIEQNRQLRLARRSSGNSSSYEQ